MLSLRFLVQILKTIFRSCSKRNYWQSADGHLNHQGATNGSFWFGWAPQCIIPHIQKHSWNKKTNPYDSGVDKRVVSKRVVLADVPPEREHIRMFPRNENRNEGTFACSPGTKTPMRARSPKPKTTLLRNRPFIFQWTTRPNPSNEGFRPNFSSWAMHSETRVPSLFRRGKTRPQESLWIPK